MSSFFSRKPHLAAALREAVCFLPGALSLEDADGKLLFGEQQPATAEVFPIQLENEILGWAKGGESATFLARLANLLLRQENEKHQLGAETLHLYREINLIFSFSEKLATVLSSSAIAELTLQEAQKIIHFASGGVFLWNEKTGQCDELAKPTGGDFLKNGTGFFQEIIQTGKSEIIAAPDSSALVLCAALKIGQRVLGGIVLRGAIFSASDLKLLSTLADLVATALENSMQHERATAQALKVQREKLTLELAMKNPFFKKVMAVAEAKCAAPEFSAAALAENLHLSPSQLQRKIAALTDLTPVQIIRDLRIRRAKDLLKTTDLTVSEVAFQAGFSDPSYFARLFARELGCTPSEWKER